jgi:tRNA G18 (ribose-2'-O)-methylase SpoU
MRFIVYQCPHPECGLRFPAQAGSLRGGRCPRCRRNVEQVAVIEQGLESTEASERVNRGHFEAVLDNLRSGWNVGAIFRTADGLGVRKLHLCGITPLPGHAQVVKTALGAEQSVPWSYAANGVAACRALSQAGYAIWALEDAPGAENIFDYNGPADSRPALLIVGNEVCGVDPGILALAEKTFYIPMHGAKRSLNVAVAFGIALSWLAHRSP